MTGVAGNYFFPGSARFLPAQLSIAPGRNIVVTGSDGTELVRAPLRAVRISARLGALMRRIELPDGARFETPDNDGVDALLRGASRFRSGSLIDRMERSLRWVAAAAVVAALAIYLFIAYGIPSAALWLANQTPRYAQTVISTQALTQIDRLMRPSTLSPADRKRALALFARVTAQGKDGVKGYRLLFRDGHIIGANAFSLPDGTVVLTDQLYRLVRRDDELEGVFGHEMAHADRRHALQAVYQASIVPAAIAVVTGDVSQVAHMAAFLPGVLIQSAYSRSLEQQADDDSAVTMKKIGADPAALGELLERLEKKECGKSGCAPSWLGDHPATAERAARLRQERATPAKH